MFVGLSVVACASRSVPMSFPKTSAASPDAEAAPVARVGVALDQDPPLPGESTEGWRGLEEQPPSEGNDEKSHQHPGHDASHGKDGSKSGQEH